MKIRIIIAFLLINICQKLFSQPVELEDPGTGGLAISTGFLIAVISIIAILTIVFLIYSNIGLWLQAKASGVKISLYQLGIMRYKKVPPEMVVKELIKAKESKLDLLQRDIVALYLAIGSLDQEEMKDKGIKPEREVEKLVDLTIKAHNAGLKSIELDELIKQYLAKVDVERVIRSLIYAHNSHLKITLNELAEHSLAHINVEELVHSLIAAHGAHIHDISQIMLAQHHHAGGHMLKVVNAIVAAKNADTELEDENKLRLNFEIAANIDLAGIDIEEAVQDAINFKVLYTEPISAFAIDGIQLTMKCRVTVRPKIRKMVRGAGKETVLARINEAIVSEIGSTVSHHKILQNPYELADKVETKKNLFEDTVYQVISIDISNIDVGKDIQSQIKKEKADADLAAARAYHLQIESEVQKAMADAFRDGNLSVHDYHRIKNTEADTDMRGAIAKTPPKDPNIAV